jgi:NADH:ubiquinone oxidoreductase subunit F (NADH-binding)
VSGSYDKTLPSRMPLAPHAVPPVPAATALPRLLPRTADGHPAREPEALTAHLARHGALTYRGGLGRLITDLQAAGLTGRGGAAFPAFRKLQAAFDAARKSRRLPVAVANGAESEPASDKDATLLWLAPHLVLDGLQLAAEAIGARRAILYTHPAATRVASLQTAIAERDAAGVDPVRIELVMAPPRFLAGQETALISHLGGGPARPTYPLPRPTERGLEGAPTLVHNVETLAHMALIARYGPDWYRAVGTAAAPGSMLCTVRRGDGTPRILETAVGTPLRDVLGPPNEKAAVLIGGYHGTWVPATTATTLTLDDASLGSVGARVGAGVLATLPTDRCGLLETAGVVRYLAYESAGQCGPCLNGLPRMAAALVELASGRPRRGVRADLERWAGLVTGRGACHHPDGTARLVRSALATFAGEADLHERGKCTAPRHNQPFLPVPAEMARSEEDWR